LVDANLPHKPLGFADCYRSVKNLSGYPQHIMKCVYSVVGLFAEAGLH